MIKWDDVIVTGNRTCFSWTYTDPDDKLWNLGGGGALCSQGYFTTQL